jgi:exodeoxyribonuclease V beta subunit
VKPIDLNAEPLDAGTLVVEASAGTGKTFAIAHLYVRLLLEQRREPAEILVVTYTKAATAELKTRIRRRIRAALSALAGEPAEDATLEELARRRHQRGQLGRDRAHLAYCLASIDRAAIFTIHGFCERVLADSAFESGVEFERELVESARGWLEDLARDFYVRELADAPLHWIEHVESSGCTPASLTRLAERLLQNPTARIRPADDPVDPEQEARTLARWRAAAERLADAWSAQSSTLRAELMRHGGLDQRSFKPEQIDAKLAAVAVEIARGRPGCSRRSRETAALAGLAGGVGVKRNHAPPVHPLLSLLTDWAAADAALAQCLERRTRALMLRFARTLPVDLRLRLADEGLHTFDDLIAGVAEALADEERGARLASTLRERYPVALVDEFQDTDPLQYEIFRRLYHGGDAPLLLIGDPKQAIYAFRGADVFTYLGARSDAARVRTLDVNWRSDPGLIRAVETLFSGAAPFDRPDIGLPQVKARPEAHDALDAPLELLVVAADQTREIARRTAFDIAERLNSEGPLANGPLGARDVAVLCRTNAQAREVGASLRELGIPAVFHGDASVFESEATADLERVARALARPGENHALRAALATRLLGSDATRLAVLDTDPGWDVHLERFHALHQRWLERGFVVAIRDLAGDAGVAERILRQVGGERYLTDVLHLAELAYDAERQLHLGPLALVEWLGHMRTGDAARAAMRLEDAQIRIESDAAAVQLTTLHRSKGLEFPAVYVPFAWGDDVPRGPDAAWPRFHDGAQLCIDLGSESWAQARAAAAQEALEEALRLLYVGVTRARHYCALVCVPDLDPARSALGRRLGQERGEGEAGLRARLETLVAASAGAIRLRALASEAPPARSARGPSAPALAPRRLERPVPASRRLSSFSALVHGGPAGEARDHDPAGVSDAGLSEAAVDPVTLADFPRGARAGSLIHEVYESIDFAKADADQVTGAVDRAVARWRCGTEQRDALVQGVLESLDAPLPPLGSLRLRDIVGGARLSELEFVVPVGTSAAGRLRAADLSAAFQNHAQRPALRRYASSLRELRFEAFSGHLRGFVDLVFRSEDRWYLADYKSSYLGAAPASYAPEQLERAMVTHHYALQYHLYTLALHRYLASRLPDYTYERDFGGVYYLFIRGLSPRHPLGNGAFFDRPPAELIEALSRAVDGFGAGAAA